MSQTLENKIYIPERVYRLPVTNLPASSSLKELFNQHKIIIIGNLQQIGDEILNKVINSHEMPFPELRHYILALQENETDEIVLISGGSTRNKNQSESKLIKEQNRDIEIVLAKTIFIPLPARDWKITDLPISEQLIGRVRMSGCGKLYDLNGVKYASFFMLKSFDEKDIFELYTFLSQLQSPEAFSALEEKVRTVAKADRKVEDLQRKASVNAKNNEPQPSVSISDTSKPSSQLPVDLKEKIETPAALRNLPVCDLAPSKKLSDLFKRINISLLGELYGISYYELEQKHNFDEESLSELRSLMAFAKKFARYTVFSSGFENIKRAALKRRENEISMQTSSSEFDAPTQRLHEKQEIVEFEKSQIKYDVDKSQRTDASSTKSFSSRISEVLDRQRSVKSKKLNLSETMDFINKFSLELTPTEREILLDRFGGSPDERILKFEAIADKHQMSRERVYQSYLKILNALKGSLQNSSKDTFEKLNDDCLSSICPLTPKFLVHLTNNEYELFQYPAGFYIRIFGILFPKIPILPELKNRVVRFEANAKKLEQEIKCFLEESHLPVSIKEVFNRLMSVRAINETVENDFFEVIQSNQFNLIETNDPKELFIELGK